MEKIAGLLILFILIIIQSASAFQASDYECNYKDLSANGVGGFAKERQIQMGYLDSLYFAEHGLDYPEFAWNRMKNDNIFFFFGHGGKGQLIFSRGTYTDNEGIIQWHPYRFIVSSNEPKIVPEDKRISDFTAGELDDLLLAAYISCHSAETDVGSYGHYGNLLDESVNRGVDTAIGFSGNIYPPQSVYWSELFWCDIPN
jgi:hypothetical protein